MYKETDHDGDITLFNASLQQSVRHIRKAGIKQLVYMNPSFPYQRPDRTAFSASVHTF